jgi:outer membrane protein OmpA-like peptidoglycan-associated protein
MNNNMNNKMRRNFYIFILGVVVLILTLMFFSPVSSAGTFLPTPAGNNVGLYYYGSNMGIQGNGCVVNPVSMTRGIHRETVTKLVEGDIVEIPTTILFDFDEDVVLELGKSVLYDNVYSKLVEFGVTEIAIIGHTDSIGTVEYNAALGLSRAVAVGAVLAYNGFPIDGIVAGTGGELYPVASNQNSVGRQKNRRVEIVITSVVDRAVQEEVVRIVKRDPQILHRPTSDSMVSCEGSLGKKMYEGLIPAIKQ